MSATLAQNDASDRPAARTARLAFAAIDAQQTKIPRSRHRYRQAVVRARAALGEDSARIARTALANRAFSRRQPAHRTRRTDASAVQRLIGIDVPDARKDRLVEERSLDRALGGDANRLANAATSVSSGSGP